MNESDFNMSSTDIRDEIIRFNSDTTAHRLRKYYNDKTFPEILGVSRRELSHSGFLAWILNPKESHGIYDFGLRRIIEILLTSKFWKSDYQQQKVFDELITGSFELTTSSIRKEVAIGSDGRVDLLAELKLEVGGQPIFLRIVFENKVLSTESKDQTKRYYSYFSSLNDNFINLFVYITPLSSLDLEELQEQECEDTHFIQINYQNIVDSLLEPALEQSIDSTNKIVISQYIQSLSQPSFDENETDFERGMIMAIGREERELLQKFWIGNQRVIQAALYAISSDPNQEKDVRDKVRDALSSIATTGKDRSAIIIKYNGVEQVRIQKADIAFETVKLLNDRGLINDEIFKWLSDDTSCSLKLLKTKDEVSSVEEKYSKYRIKKEPELKYKGHGYYIARNWGISNTEKFISKFEAKFPELKYEFDTRV